MIKENHLKKWGPDIYSQVRCMGGQHVSARGRKRRERTEREGSRNQVERSFSSWSYLSSGIGGKEIHVNERK